MTSTPLAGLRPENPPRLRLAEVLRAIDLPPAATDPVVSGITHDSRDVRPGDLYIAVPGLRQHGITFVDDALSAGAVAVVTDAEGVERAGTAQVPVIAVSDVRAVMGPLAAAVYGHPADRLTMLGVTGTNGKTTTTYLLEAALRAAGRRTGLIGTIETRIGDDAVVSARTTPEATDLHALLAVMVERGIEAVVMEVSSHALVMGRVGGVVFNVGAFLNLSQDHLDFHGTMEEYFAAKARLLTPELSRRGVIVVDDAWGRRLARETVVPCVAVSIDDGPADVIVRALPAPAPTAQGAGGRRCGAVERTSTGGTLAVPQLPEQVCTTLPGAWNLSNAAVALVMAALAGGDGDAAAEGIAALPAVPGRLEPVAGRPYGYVDYAHTPDAVDSVLALLRREAPERRLVAVLGCGGDRDAGKRPLMGAAAARHADVVIVTDDNPRGEDPSLIRAAVVDGASSAAHGVAGRTVVVLEEADRAVAIRRAATEAGADGVVAVLGKGHETGQEVAGVVTPFDDRQVLREVLQEGRP